MTAVPPYLNSVHLQLNSLKLWTISCLTSDQQPHEYAQPLKSFTLKFTKERLDLELIIHL